MKKSVIALVMIIAGILLVGAGYIMVGANLEGFNSESVRTSEKSYVCKGKVTDIVIKETSGIVMVRKGNTDTVEISYFDSEKEPRYDIAENGGRLSVIRKDKINFMFFNLDLKDDAMTVTVPADYTGPLDIGNTSGRIALDGVTGQKITMNNTSGKIELTNVKSETDLSVSNTSGSITLTQTEAGGNISASTTSGSIKPDGLKAGGDISLSTVSGSIKGTIDGAESDYRINAHAVSGSNNLQNSDKGEKKLDVKTTSGSIGIEFLK